MKAWSPRLPCAVTATSIVVAAFVLWAAPSAAAEHEPEPQPEPETASPEAELLRRVVQSACPSEIPQEGAVGVALEDVTLVEETPLIVRSRKMGWRRRFMVHESGAQVMLEGIAPGGTLRRVVAEYHLPTQSGLRPQLMVLADARCRIQTGRRLIYDADGRAESIERLDAALADVEVREPLNPPVPVGEGLPGVNVALVDAGVNYLLPEIGERLARDSDGTVLGYDYWDLDPRPFDANPARSPFFPQRHGTQTASLLLAEAPVIRLVPYRYPRPAMGRMGDLIEAAAAKRVVVVNLSLGGNRGEDWQAFREAAIAHPEMLFVVSAGNNGRDIDAQPVFPAALTLENMLTVSSANPDGRPARGSNWGRESVDLLVPAEGLLVTDFHGRPKVVSGSSYAAARISALAACLSAEHPDWRAPELKEAILGRARALADEADAYSKHGFLPDPTTQQRGACPPTRHRLQEMAAWQWADTDLESETAPAMPVTHELKPTLVVFENAGWLLETVQDATAKTRQIFAQCGVAMPKVSVRVMEGPKRFKIFRNDWAIELVSKMSLRRPAVFFVQDTLQEIAFDAEAIGRSNGRSRPQLIGTVWMTAAIEDPGIGLAHELYHVLANYGYHDPDPMNLMHERSNGENTTLRAHQCLRMVKVGETFGNLKPVQ